MKIDFYPLNTSHFTLLLKWLNSNHVKKWYDPEINWNIDLIAEKYSTYTSNYKLENDVKKPIYPFIIKIDSLPIGYIQYYNAYDFPRENYKLENLPLSLAAIDIFIGEENFLGKGFGNKIISLFLEEIVFKNFDNVLVDPELENIQAIKAYNKAGFNKVSIVNNKLSIMIKSKDNII